MNLDEKFEEAEKSELIPNIIGWAFIVWFILYFIIEPLK